MGVTMLNIGQWGWEHVLEPLFLPASGVDWWAGLTSWLGLRDLSGVESDDDFADVIEEYAAEAEYPGSVWAEA
jgi:hypothetical protein